MDTLLTGPAILAAIMSGAAGYGFYIAARVLFPFALLLSQLEGSNIIFSKSVGLRQFSLYGALIGWSGAGQAAWAFLLATAHLVAALECILGFFLKFRKDECRLCTTYHRSVVEYAENPVAITVRQTDQTVRKLRGRP